MAIFRYSKNVSLAIRKFEIRTVWEKRKSETKTAQKLQSLKFCFTKEKKRIETFIGLGLLFILKIQMLF